MNALVELDDHVVAQVVEAEFVVGAVGNVGRVRFLAAGGAQVDEAFVSRWIPRLEHVRGVVRDHSNGQAEQVVDRAHPLAVAPGQVVIWRDDVDASPGQGVERGRERRREGFSLAGPHLGDLALVKDHAPDQLDVEMALAEGSLCRFSSGSEDFRKDLVQRLLDSRLLFLTARLRDLLAALQVGMVEFVLVGLVRLDDLA